MTPYYEQKLSEGHYYQDFVIEELYKIGLPLISYASKQYQCLYGENKAGIEIKNDQKFRKTGNFYIEIAEKSNASNENFIASGIYRNDNTWLYIIGDEYDIYIFAKNQLRALHTSKQLNAVSTPTSKGFLLPVEMAVNKYYVIKSIQIKEYPGQSDLL